MMNKIIRTTLIALLLTFAAHAAAQQGLQIATVFQKYGKQKGVTMVRMILFIIIICCFYIIHQIK